MTALLIVLGIIGILWAIPSPQPTMSVTVNRTTHVHVHVQAEVRVMNLEMPPPVPIEEPASKAVPTAVALKRYRAPELPSASRKFLA